MNAISPKTDSLALAHDFRSRLIEEVARVEAWAVSIIQASGQKPPQLGGQKLLAAAKCLSEANRNDVAAQLEAFKPFAELRGLLCHSLLSRPGGPNYCFRPVAADGVLAWRPVLLSETEMTAITSDARAAADALLKNKL